MGRGEKITSGERQRSQRQYCTTAYIIIRKALISNASYFSILQWIHDIVIFEVAVSHVHTHSRNILPLWCICCPNCCDNGLVLSYGLSTYQLGKWHVWWSKSLRQSRECDNINICRNDWSWQDGTILVYICLWDWRDETYLWNLLSQGSDWMCQACVQREGATINDSLTTHC